MDRLNPLNDYALALYRAREDSAHERANLIYTGKMEGIEIGIEKGKIEGNREDAKKMLAKKLSPDLIAEVTGLSIEEIIALQAVSDKISQ